MKKMPFLGGRKARRRRGTAQLFVLGATFAATSTVPARPAQAQTPATEGRTQTPAARTFRFALVAGTKKESWLRGAGCCPTEEENQRTDGWWCNKLSST